MLKDKALILAAGSGSRMNIDSSDYKPKALTECNGKLLIMYALESLEYAGISECYIVINKLDVGFNKIYYFVSQYKMKIEFIYEDIRLGSLKSFFTGDKFLSQDFFLLDCDIYMPDSTIKNMKKEINVDNNNGNMCSVYIAIAENIWNRQNNLKIEHKRLVAFNKNGENCNKFGGMIYYFKENLFSSAKEYIDLSCYSLSNFINDISYNRRINGIPIGYVWDNNSQSDIKNTEEYLRLNQIVK